jgi:hypothetical protein
VQCLQERLAQRGRIDAQATQDLGGAIRFGQRGQGEEDVLGSDVAMVHRDGLAQGLFQSVLARTGEGEVPLLPGLRPRRGRDEARVDSNRGQGLLFDAIELPPHRVGRQPGRPPARVSSAPMRR